MTIHLLDDSFVDSNGLTLDRSTYHIFVRTAQGEQLDITDLLTRLDKKAIWADFDEARENRRLSEERGAGGDATPKSTNVTEIFVDQVTHDPFAATADAIDSVIKGTKNFVKGAAERATSTPVYFLGVIVAGVVVYSLLKKK